MNSAFCASLVHRSCIFRKPSYILHVSENYGPPLLINVSQELSRVWEWGSHAFFAGGGDTKSLPGGLCYYTARWQAGIGIKQY